MDKNTPALRLHDRLTRGEALTAAERQDLDAWYGRQDREEEAILAAADPALPPTLRAEVNAALARLVAVTGQIQALMDENEALRREIVSLNQRLAQTASSQSA